MDHAGINYTVVDLKTNAAALEYVQDLGYSQAPWSLASTTIGQASTRSRLNGSDVP